MQQEQKKQGEIYRRLEQRQLCEPGEPAEDIEEPIFVLPCNTIDDLQHLDSQLKTDHTRRKMVRNLSLLGGVILKSVVYRMMHEIVTHQLSMTMNLSGVKGKQPLNIYTEIMRAIHKAVRKNGNFHNTTEKEVDTSLGRWLSGAKDIGAGPQ
ncbi:PREDICTED: uncharacterized protein LOC106815933 [Priapulus caudatus]|uniref:Uncharacterized protein LOC106815933 n=1 Tax=Priapulus caudatus TaxID=37621 RepID=A0ABM1EUT0_PRICU|nr:PREDICTED: uncharacterized protein LOC106815933 [Priapulus caudatus]